MPSILPVCFVVMWTPVVREKDSTVTMVERFMVFTSLSKGSQLTLFTGDLKQNQLTLSMAIE